MVRRFYNLPSLTSLSVFEAAARHLSFKQAAAELNVTPGAVSRQIKGLERETGVPLFVRAHRAVELTPEGEELHAVLARSFSQTSEVFDRLRVRADDTSVTLGANTAFASMWLMPKLGAFWRAHPDITLNHVISDHTPDLRRADIDLRIRYGSGVWPGDKSAFMFGDRIFPVCSPRYAAKWKGAGAADLAGLDLLRLEGVDPEWTTWEEFLKHAELPPAPRGGRRFNNYAVTLQAAQDGQGVALGWERLVRPLVASGKLKRLTDAEIVAPSSFHVTWSTSRELPGHVQVLRDWLLEMAWAEEADD